MSIPQQLMSVFRGGASSNIQIFLVVSTCFLYLVAAGLFSRAVWFFETQEWNDLVGGDAAELGYGPGSYDIDRSVWHVNVSAGFRCPRCPTLTFPLSSVVVRPSMVGVVGESSTPSLAGTTLPLTAQSSHTTATGSQSFPDLCCYVIGNRMAAIRSSRINLTLNHKEQHRPTSSLPKRFLQRIRQHSRRYIHLSESARYRGSD